MGTICRQVGEKRPEARDRRLTESDQVRIAARILTIYAEGSVQVLSLLESDPRPDAASIRQRSWQPIMIHERVLMPENSQIGHHMTVCAFASDTACKPGTLAEIGHRIGVMQLRLAGGADPACLACSGCCPFHAWG